MEIIFKKQQLRYQHNTSKYCVCQKMIMRNKFSLGHAHWVENVYLFVIEIELQDYF